MKNVLHKSMFVLLLCGAVTSFGMKPSRRSASHALGQQENNKRQKSDLVVPAIQEQIQIRGSRSVRDVLAAAASSSNQNYQNQAHSSTQAIIPMPAITLASNFDAKNSVNFYPEWNQKIKDFVLSKLQKNTPYRDIEKEWNESPGNERISIDNIATFRNLCDPSFFPLAKQGPGKIENCPRLKKHIDSGLEQGMGITQIVKTWEPLSEEPTITYTPIKKYILRKNNSAAAASMSTIIIKSNSDAKKRAKSYIKWTQEIKDFILLKLQENTSYRDIAEEWNKNHEEQINKSQIEKFRDSCDPSLFPLFKEGSNKIERCLRLKEHIDAGLAQGMSQRKIVKTWKPEAGEPTITHKTIGSYILKKNNAAAATAGQQIVDDSMSDDGTITDASDVDDSMSDDGAVADVSDDEGLGNALASSSCQIYDNAQMTIAPVAIDSLSDPNYLSPEELARLDATVEEAYNLEIDDTNNNQMT